MTIQELKPVIRSFGKRNIMKWLNILGLAIGIASAVLIINYIFNELEVGRTQANYEELFLLKRTNATTNSSKAIESIQANVPEIRNAVSFHNQWGDAFYKIGDKVIKAEKLLIGDDTFFNIFSCKAIFGDLSTALQSPDNIVITRNTADKLFGNVNPVGEDIFLESDLFGKLKLSVSAVIDNPNTNAFVQFNGYINQKAITHDWYRRGRNHWGNQNYLTFTQIPKGVNKAELGKKITNVINDNAPDWFIKDGKEYELVNISELHFSSIDFWGIFRTNDKRNLFTLGLIGVFLLIISWVNFINLSTAQQERLSFIASIKKSLGASKLNLVLSSILEIVPIVIVAFLIAVVLVVISYKPFNDFTNVYSDLQSLLTVKTVLFSAFFMVATILVCSMLPHWLMGRHRNTSSSLRAVLSTLQFVISIALIIATVAIIKQNSFIKNKDRGYVSENILCLELKGSVGEKGDVLGDKIEKYGMVQEITYASRLISDVQQDWGMTLDNRGEQTRIQYSVLEVTDNFFSFFNIPILKGDGFNEASEKQKHHIFNEVAQRKFNLVEIDDARIASYGSATGDIVGVVKDFNFRSLHLPIAPLGFIKSPKSRLKYLYIKLKNNSVASISNCISLIEKDWQTMEADWPAEVQFLSSASQKLYESDKKFSELILIVALLSIFISCVGLLGVSKFIAEQRTKEIGIRKVNGARIAEVLVMLNANFIKWVILAFIIASPIAYYAMSKWLENFAYKTSLSWWIFALAGILALGIALFTVTWQSWRAATRNPVEALRYE
ncbi:ABC transporter permease [Prolixibacteraceae bacterium JC049]|nr:ABC transporter permease [Prolixibacteraceae bacterium JC049]